MSNTICLQKIRVVYESFKKNGLFNVQMRIHFLLPFANYLLLFASSFGLLFMSGFHSRQIFLFLKPKGVRHMFMDVFKSNTSPCQG